MATICVPNRRVVTCQLTGVQARMDVHCLRPVKPVVHICDVPLLCPVPTYTELIGAFGVSRVMQTLGAAKANPDEFVWGVYEHLRGRDSVEWMRAAFGESAGGHPSAIVEGLVEGSSPQDREYDNAGSGSRVVGPKGRGWARGILDRDYNRGLGRGGLAQIGPAGIKGEADAADRGEKDWPEEVEDYVPPEEWIHGPNVYICRPRWVECTEEDERGSEWGDPESPAVPDPSRTVDLGVPLPEIVTDSRWTRGGPGARSVGPSASGGRYVGRLTITDGLRSGLGGGADFSRGVSVNLGEVGGTDGE